MRPEVSHVRDGTPSSAGEMGNVSLEAVPRTLESSTGVRSTPRLIGSKRKSGVVVAKTAEERALVEATKAEALQKSRKAQLAEDLNDITEKGIAAAKGLLLKAGDPGYNPDADALWSERTGRTAFASQVYKEHMQAQREKQAQAVQFGMVVLKNRLEEKEWEAHAQRVDRGEEVIDVEESE